MWWSWLSKDDPPLGDGEVPKWVQWIIGGFGFLLVAGFFAVNFWVGDQQPDPEDRAEIAALEDTLRSRGAVEDARGRYEAVMQRIADELTAAQPGLTWRWDPQVAGIRCSGEFEDTSGVQLRRRLIASGPITDDRWASAHQIVRDHAAGIGVSYVSGFELPGGLGGAIDLTQRDVAVLSGVTPCQLRRDHLGG